MAPTSAPASGGAEQTEVLIVGGGIVGLSAALFLRHQGVRCILVERRQAPSDLPRSRGVHVRTMELFRQVGVEAPVLAAAAGVIEQGGFGGARRGATLMEAEPLRRPGPGGGPPRPRGMAEEGLSPSSFCFCPQAVLEPALRAAAEARGADIRFGAELTGFAQGAEVTAEIAGRAGNARGTIRAHCMIAADGGAGTVRGALGIGTSGAPAREHYLNVFFRADLTEQVRGRTFSQCEVANDRVRGLFASHNNTDLWTFHLGYDPAAEAPRDYPPSRIAALLRDAAGLPGLDVELLSTGPWDTAVHIADRYRDRAVFLAGDAAHRHPPWGGFGANTGIADAHNLAWNLAAVLRGHAAPQLLDTYEQERRPLAVLAGEQSLLLTDFDARYGVVTPGNAGEVARQIGATALLMRHRYASAAVIGAGGSDGRLWVERLAGQPGTRAPHAWIERSGGRGEGGDGRDTQTALEGRLSTLDLFGRAFVLVAGPDGSRWEAGARRAAEERGLPLAVHRIGRDASQADLADGEDAWATMTRTPPDAALLVRPDGYVAARLEPPHRPEDLARMLDALAGRRAWDAPSPPAP